MRELIKLNTDESIIKKRLVFEESWTDKFNRLTVYIAFSPIIFLPVTMFFEEDFVSLNDIFIRNYIFPILIAAGLYIFYRNATEKRLIQIDTKLSRQDIRKILLDYADKNQLEIYRKSSDCIILNESFDSWTPRYKKTRIFFIQDNLVLFTVIRDNFRLNMPVLFTHLFLKSDLKKMLRESKS